MKIKDILKNNLLFNDEPIEIQSLPHKLNCGMILYDGLPNDMKANEELMEYEIQKIFSGYDLYNKRCLIIYVNQNFN